MTATPVFDAIRLAAGVFVRRGGLDTSVMKVRFKPPFGLFLFFSDDFQSIEHKHLCLNSNIQKLVLILHAVCPKGSYGVRYAQRCPCYDNAHCDPMEGTCQCSAGRTGKHC